MKITFVYRYKGPLGWFCQILQWCRLVHVSITINATPEEKPS